jgi:antitoxin HigA-1
VTEKLYPPIHPGEVLLEDFLKPMGISQYRLAKTIGVPPRRINEIVHGKRRITAETGIRLSRALGLSDPYWINMQANYDLEVERDNHQSEIDAITPLTA